MCFQDYLGVRRCERVGCARSGSHRSGKVLVLMAVMLPTLFGILALVIDAGLMMRDYRAMQHATDAAATAATVDLRLGLGAARASQTAQEYVGVANGKADAAINVHIPPTAGEFAGRNNFVEVDSTLQHKSRFSRLFDRVVNRSIRTQSVAGLNDVTAGAAIVVLDPNPNEVTLPSSSEVTDEIPADDLSSQAVEDLDVDDSLPGLGLGANLPVVRSQLENALTSYVLDTVDDVLAEVDSALPLPATPTLTAGMEIEGLGRLRVDGAILVNNEWGGKDENGDIVSDTGFTYGVACMPLISTTRVYARDIRVVGGVDNPNNFRNFASGQPTPLQANRLPVPDPFKDLPVPSVASDANNVDTRENTPADVVVVALGTNLPLSSFVDDIVTQVLSPLPGLVRAVVEPLITPIVQTVVATLQTPPRLRPGVYNSITVISVGRVTFDPGVYVVRGTSPLTKMSVALLGGDIQADGVLFYVTSSLNFSASTGSPDASQPAAQPPNPLLAVKPSVVIAPLIATSHITGLNAPGSPFHGLLVYQQRTDRRPIILGATKLLGGGDLTGTIYSKWGHVVFLGGSGTYDLRFVSGTLRVLTVFDTTIAPATLLPAAQDVLLVE